MALCCKWFAHLFLLLFAVQALETSQVNDLFYSRLKYLLNLIPENSQQESNDVGEVTEIENWPAGSLPNVGQISGVSVNSHGQPVIFHRGPRVWDFQSFNSSNHFQQIAEGPIKVNTVVTLDQEFGNVISSWGANFFYMPHGIHIDPEGNTWLTDVALHQVFKFSRRLERPVLTFGQRFKPGSGLGHLCKPTSVAVAGNGHVFIADGYCNSRILKFNQYGEVIRVFPQTHEFLSLKVPHSLALIEQRGLLCIADRDNMRVVCVNSDFDHAPTHSQLNIQQPDLGRVFAIASKGDSVFAVNGPTSPHLSVQGFTIDPLSESITDHWKPISDKFYQPHDLAVSPDGAYLYIAELEPSRLWKFSL